MTPALNHPDLHGLSQTLSNFTKSHKKLETIVDPDQGNNFLKKNSTSTYKYKPASIQERNDAISFSESKQKIAEFKRAFLERNDDIGIKCKNSAIHIYSDLIENKLIPIRVSIIEDNSLCLTLAKSNVKVYLEIYDDGSMGFIAENVSAKEIIDNRDVESRPELIDYLRRYLK